MRKSFIFYLCILALPFSSCKKRPVFPDTPQIEFAGFKEDPSADKLTVSLNFKDGNGDLGLDDSYKTYPYEEYDFIKDANGNLIKYGSSSSLPPLTCKNYILGYFFSDTIQEYALIKQNPNYYNYFADLYYKQGSTFVKLDVSNICPDFNGRFPLLSDQQDKGPIEGVLDYNIPGFYSNVSTVLYNAAITTDAVKFRITIQDRAMHKSNEIETPELKLP